MTWQPITLGRAVRKDADRVAGCEYVIPWPDGLPPGPPLALDDERDATSAEGAAARAIVEPAASAARLAIVSVVVARLGRPTRQGIERPGEVDDHLVLLLRGRRWLDAVDPPSPGLRWAAHGRVRCLAEPDSPTVSGGCNEVARAPPDVNVWADPMSTPDALRAYRARLGLTQRQLCRRWDVPLSTLKNWEQGVREPSPPGPVWRLIRLDTAHLG